MYRFILVAKRLKPCWFFLFLLSWQQVQAQSTDPDADLLFNASMPVLTTQDTAALSMSLQAADADRYPVQDGDRTLHLYGSGQATLVCAILKVCVIELQAGEVVAQNGIHLGDAVRWNIQPAVGEGKKTFLMVKPKTINLETNLVVITNRHSYDVRLISKQQARISKIAWSYPADTAAAWQKYYQQVNAAKTARAETSQAIRKRQTLPETREVLPDLDFNYVVTGCERCDWRPVRVYNNGKQTVIEFPDLSGKEAPALLVMNNQGDALVNYRVKGNRYLVDQVFRQAVLLLGVGEQQQRVVLTRQGATQ